MSSYGNPIDLGDFFPDTRDDAGSGSCYGHNSYALGNRTLSVFIGLTGGASEAVLSTKACSAIPRKSGGSLSLTRMQLSGQDVNAASVGPDGWMPAGGGAAFAFLPFLGNPNGVLGSPYIIQTGSSAFSYSPYFTMGTVTYYTSDSPRPVSARVDTSTYFFTDINAALGTKTVYGASGNKNKLAGRIIKRVDKNANAIYYNYSQSSSAPSTSLLRKLTGDISGITPYFQYASEALPAPITKIFLSDNVNQANSRSFYYQYDATGTALQKVTFPNGCTTNYNNILFTNVNGSYSTPQKEIDSVGNATYFNYSSSTSPQIVTKGVEQAGRTTYFNYPNSAKQVKTQSGRPSFYYLYNSVSGGKTLISRQVDPLGNVTYYQYTTVNDLLSETIAPNGNISYFYYDVHDMVVTRKVTQFNGAMTYYKYESNNQDIQKMIGPRNIVGTFPVVTYYQYDGNRNRTVTTDALNNSTLTIPDSLGRIRKVQDARSNTTYYNYNAISGQRSSIVDARNQATYFAYNSFADRTRVVSPRWRESGSYAAFTSYYQFDSRDRQTKSIDTLSQSSYFSYTSDGDLQVTVDPRNVTQYYLYNGLRLKTKALTSSNGVNVSSNYYVYDSYKNRTKQMDANAHWSYYFYDAIDRQTVTQDALGNATYFFYDSVSNRIKQRDARVNTSYYFYDLLSRMTSQRDAMGHATYFGYDLANNRYKAQNARAYTSYYAFDALDRLITTTDPLNGVVNTAYDPVGNQRKMQNPRNFTTYYTYDSLNRRTAQVDALNNLTYFGFDAASNPVRTRDALLRTTTTRFDVLNRVNAVRNALGGSAYFGYDPVGNRRKMQDQRQNTTYYTFDALSRTNAQVDALNNLTYFGYDPVGNRIEMRDARMNTTVTRYDAINRATAVRDPVGNSAYFGYDAVSNRYKVQDRRQNTSYFVFDADNRVNATVNALNKTATATYDPVGNVVKTTDQNVNPTYFAFDALNRRSRLTNAMGSSTYYFYDAASNRTKVRDQVVTCTYFFYDGLNRPSVIRDGLTQPSYFYYDQVGNRTKIRNANFHLTYYAYDVLNRLSTIQDAINDVTYFGYDAVSNRVMIRDGLMHTNVSRYDKMNRVTAMQDGALNSVYFGYDAVGNRLKQQDQRQNTTYFSYDAINRLSTVLDPLGYSSSFLYDQNSNLRATIDNLGQCNYFQYDALNRCTQIGYGDFGYGIQGYGTTPYGGGTGEIQTFTYDAVGNLLTASATASALSYRYDSLNRVTRKTSDSTSAYFSYLVRGDNQNFLRAIYHPGNVTAYYNYNNAQALSSVISPAQKTTTYVRNRINNVTKRQFGNQTVCYYGYDTAERLTQMQHFTSTGQGLAYFNYQRDAANRVTRIVREMATIYYSYDNADRLTSERWLKKGTVTQIYGFQYTYDTSGNRTKGYRIGTGGEIDASYYIYDASNALSKRIVLPAGTLTYYSYDANGSIVKIYEGTNATYFTYAPSLFVTQITPPAGTGQPWQFAYDGQHLKRKIVKGAAGASYYLWNDMNQLEERNSAGALTARYTHGDPIFTGVGSVVEVQRTVGATTYFQYLAMDQQGSVAKVTDVNQKIQIAYVFDAFGRQIVAPSGANPAVPNDLVFHSNWITANVGTKQYGISPGGRVYDSETGRFLQRDRVPNVVNLYTAKMIPNGLDPTGYYDVTYTPINPIIIYPPQYFGVPLYSIYPAGIAITPIIFPQFGFGGLPSFGYSPSGGYWIHPSPLIPSGGSINPGNTGNSGDGGFYGSDGQGSPERLTYETIAEPQAGECGNIGFGDWHTEWKLSGSLGTDRGVIAQRIYHDIEVKDCSGKTITQESYWYWEAWGVTTQGGNGIEIFPENNDHWYYYSLTPPACSKGHITVTGRAGFFPVPYPDLPGWKLGNLWNSPQVNSIGLMSFPGIDPNTNLITNPPNEVVRTLNYIWDCCPPNSVHTVFHN